MIRGTSSLRALTPLVLLTGAPVQAVEGTAPPGAPVLYGYALPKPPGTRCIPGAINDRGQVAGTFWKSDTFSIAFLTGERATGITQIELPSSIAWVTGINNLGQVVGTHQPSLSDGAIAFVTEVSGQAARDLPTPPDTISSYPVGINDAGQVAGEYRLSDFSYHAFISEPGGHALRPLEMPAGSWSSASAINNSGQVVGRYYADPIYRAFVTGPDGFDVVDLGTFGGSNAGAKDINDAGVVVGIVEIGWSSYRLFLVGPTSPNPGKVGPQSTHLEVGAIDPESRVVGDGDIYPRPFISNAKGERVPLADLIVNLPRMKIENAVDINASGQILAAGHGDCFVICRQRDCFDTPKGEAR